ncbi:hypothetical protein VNO77_03149 [Canavalia gladiata]|uniref:Uncharacterized protein n=1 Tax=Canavalia gladiata TaxID=3824 RepID=A0AAN9MUZ6_CANGL
MNHPGTVLALVSLLDSAINGPGSTSEALEALSMSRSHETSAHNKPAWAATLQGAWDLHGGFVIVHAGPRRLSRTKICPTGNLPIPFAAQKSFLNYRDFNITNRRCISCSMNRASPVTLRQLFGHVVASHFQFCPLETKTALERSNSSWPAASSCSNLTLVLEGSFPRACGLYRMDVIPLKPDLKPFETAWSAIRRSLAPGVYNLPRCMREEPTDCDKPATMYFGVHDPYTNCIGPVLFVAYKLMDKSSSELAASIGRAKNRACKNLINLSLPTIMLS